MHFTKPIVATTLLLASQSLAAPQGTSTSVLPTSTSEYSSTSTSIYPTTPADLPSASEYEDLDDSYTPGTNLEVAWFETICSSYYYYEDYDYDSDDYDTDDESSDDSSEYTSKMVKRQAATTSATVSQPTPTFTSTPSSSTGYSSSNSDSYDSYDDDESDDCDDEDEYDDYDESYAVTSFEEDFISLLCYNYIPSDDSYDDGDSSGESSKVKRSATALRKMRRSPAKAKATGKRASVKKSKLQARRAALKARKAQKPKQRK